MLLFFSVHEGVAAIEAPHVIILVLLLVAIFGGTSAPIVTVARKTLLLIFQLGKDLLSIIHLEALTK